MADGARPTTVPISFSGTRDELLALLDAKLKQLEGAPANRSESLPKDLQESIHDWVDELSRIDGGRTEFLRRAQLLQQLTAERSGFAKAWNGVGATIHQLRELGAGKLSTSGNGVARQHFPSAENDFHYKGCSVGQSQLVMWFEGICGRHEGILVPAYCPLNSDNSCGPADELTLVLAGFAGVMPEQVCRSMLRRRSRLTPTELRRIQIDVFAKYVGKIYECRVSDESPQIDGTVKLVNVHWADEFGFVDAIVNFEPQSVLHASQLTNLIENVEQLLDHWDNIRARTTEQLTRLGDQRALGKLTATRKEVLHKLRVAATTSVAGCSMWLVL